MATNKNSAGKAKAKSTGVSTAAVIGGIAAAAAVGGYFLYNNKDAQKKVKAVKGWVLKAKGEVLEKVEKLKEVNQDLYHKAIDAVLAKYQSLSHIDTTEVAKVAKELKSHWKAVQSELSQSSKKVSAVVKTTAKAVKKAAVAKAPKTPASGMKKA